MKASIVRWYANQKPLLSYSRVAREKVARFKIPKFFHQIEELPETVAVKF